MRRKRRRRRRSWRMWRTITKRTEVQMQRHGGGRKLTSDNLRTTMRSMMNGVADISRRQVLPHESKRELLLSSHICDRFHCSLSCSRGSPPPFLVVSEVDSSASSTFVLGRCDRVRRTALSNRASGSSQQSWLFWFWRWRRPCGQSVAHASQRWHSIRRSAQHWWCNWPFGGAEWRRGEKGG